MIRPEVDHHLTQLPLRQRGSHDRELLQLAAQLPKLLHRAGIAHPRRIAGCGGLALQTLTLTGRIAIPAGKIGAIVIEDLELPLALRDVIVRDVIGIQLALDPPDHAEARDAVRFAGTSAVRQSIQRVKRRITRRQRRELRGERENEDEVHVAILTPPPVRS